ncbi:hypothetical protein BH11MYX1_BH11MYX1_55890 [soil metagenome]
MPSSMFRTLALIATASACGKDAPSPRTKADPHAPAAATATGRKPCDYVKRADAEKAVGMALPDTDENVTTSECGYLTPQFYGSSVMVGPWESGCNIVVKNEGGQRQQKIAGLGDEAFFTREHLIIHKGERCLAVSINGPLPDAEEDGGLARVTALALTILPAI